MILIHNLFERNWIIRLVGLCCVLQYPFGDGKRKHMQVRDQQRCEHTHTLRRGAEGRGKWLVGNEVYAWVGMRQYKPRSFAAGRWVLTATRSMHGNVGKCKTKWFLRGFLIQRRRGVNRPTARQPYDLRSLLSCSHAANSGSSFTHVVCQLPQPFPRRTIRLTSELD